MKKGTFKILAMILCIVIGLFSTSIIVFPADENIVISLGNGTGIRDGIVDIGGFVSKETSTFGGSLTIIYGYNVLAIADVKLSSAFNNASYNINKNYGEGVIKINWLGYVNLNDKIFDLNFTIKENCSATSTSVVFTQVQLFGDVNLDLIPCSLINGKVNIPNFIINNPVFTDVNNQPVEDLKENQLIKINSKIKNNSLNQQNVCLVAALCDDDSVIKLSCFSKPLSSLEQGDFNCSIMLPNYISGCKIKVFVWDSLSTLKPYGNVYEFPEY